jgi:ribosome-associated translation inhibitor RaiA
MDSVRAEAITAINNAVDKLTEAGIKVRSAKNAPDDDTQKESAMEALVNTKSAVIKAKTEVDKFLQSINFAKTNVDTNVDVDADADVNANTDIDTDTNIVGE